MSNRKKFTILSIAFAFALTSFGAFAFTVTSAVTKSAPEPQLKVAECTWGQIKDCLSDNPSPGNTCCKKKKEQAYEQMVATKGCCKDPNNCTWGEIKACYEKKKKEQVAISASDGTNLFAAKQVTWGWIKCKYDPKCAKKKEG